MATLEKIRSKAALLVVVIGLALLAFIIGDFLNSGQSFFMMNQNKVATVNGKTIGVELFQDRVNARTEQMQNMYQQNGMTMPEGMSANIQLEVLEQMVNEQLLQEEFDAVGITVSDAELQDMLTGNNIHAEIKRAFVNPATGVFDQAALENYLNVVFHPEENGFTDPAQLQQIAVQRQAWLDMEDQIRQSRQYEKFMNLLMAAATPNKIDAEMAYAAQTRSVDVAYVVQPFTSIADSTIEVSASELKAEYNKEKVRYEKPETRSIRYIAVEVKPSAFDYARVQEKINMLLKEFSTTNDVASIVDNNADAPYADVYEVIDRMTGDKKSFVENAHVGVTSDPIFADEAYTLYRIMGTKTAPDTITIQMVNFAMNDPRIDSIYNVLKGGASFESLGAEFNVTNEFAVTEDMYETVGRAFVQDVFAADKACFKTSSLGGAQHIAKVVKRSAPVAKAKVATLSIAVEPSVETETALYNNLSSYVAKYNNVEQFADSAFAWGYSAIPVEFNASQAAISGLQNSRQLIHWAFNAKKGDLSEVYEIDGRYVVAILEKVSKEGYRAMEDMEVMLTNNVRREKKAAAIAQNIAAAAPTTLEEYAVAMSAQVDTAKFVSAASASIAGVGYEPKVAGAAAGLEMGKISAPVTGNRGVYVMQVVNENSLSRPYDEAAEMSRLEQQYINAVNQFVEVLKDNAKIENTMVRFF